MISCSSDDNSSGTNSELQSLLIGTWSVQSLTVEGRLIGLLECDLLFEKKSFYLNKTMLEQYGKRDINGCTKESFQAFYDVEGSVLEINREYENRDLFWKITFLDDNTLEKTLISVREEGAEIEDVPEGRRETYIYSRDK